MLKILLDLLFKLIMVFIVAGVLTWLYNVFNQSAYFIFFVMVFSGLSYDRLAKKVEDLHKRTMELEEDNRNLTWRLKNSNQD